ALIKFGLVDGFVPDRRADLRGQGDWATTAVIDPRLLGGAVVLLWHAALGQVRRVDPPLRVRLQAATLLEAVHDPEDIRNDRVLPAEVTRLVPLARVLGCRALTRLRTNQDLQRDVEGRREGLERVHEEVLGVRQVNLRQPRSHALDHQQLVETLLPVRHLVVHDLDNLLGRYAHRSRDLLDVGLLVHLEDRGLLRVLPEALAACTQDLLDRDQVVDARLQGRVAIHRPIEGPDDDARRVYLELAGANVTVHRGHAHRALVILVHLRLTVGQRRRVSVVVNDLQLLLPYRDDVDESVQSTLDAPDWLVQRLPVPYAQYDRTIFAYEAPAVRLHHLGPEPDLVEVVPDRLLEPRDRKS